MLSYFDDNDSAPKKTVKVEFKNVKSAGGVKLTYYCLDKARDCEPCARRDSLRKISART